MKKLIEAIRIGWPVTIGSIIVQAVVFGTFSWQITIAAIITGLLFGFSFVLIQPYIKKYADTHLLGKIKIIVPENEHVVLEGGANHFVKSEAVGGKLLLTDKRIIFKSHKFNFQNHEQSFLLYDLKDVRKEEKYKLGFSFELRNNEIHKFNVDAPQEWIDTLRNKLQAA